MDQNGTEVKIYLEGVEEKCEENFDVTQDSCGLLIGGKDENHFMNPKQRHEG